MSHTAAVLNVFPTENPRRLWREKKLVLVRINHRPFLEKENYACFFDNASLVIGNKE